MFNRTKSWAPIKSHLICQKWRCKNVARRLATLYTCLKEKQQVVRCLKSATGREEEERRQVQPSKSLPCRNSTTRQSLNSDRIITNKNVKWFYTNNWFLKKFHHNIMMKRPIFTRGYWMRLFCAQSYCAQYIFIFTQCHECQVCNDIVVYRTVMIIILLPSYNVILMHSYRGVVCFVVCTWLVLRGFRAHPGG